MEKKIYQIAKELNISHIQILKFLESKSIKVKNHMAFVNNDIYDLILLEFSEEKKQNLISFLTGATPSTEEDLADLFNEFKALAENIITDPIEWENDYDFEDEGEIVFLGISGIMMSENDKFRLTLDNDGLPCLDIYGIISPRTKLTASFSEYDKRYNVEDQLNNVLKDIQNKATGVYHKYYKPGDFG